MKHVVESLLKYVVTAGAAAVVDLGGFVMLLRWGIAELPAAVISFLCALIVNYALTSRMVFAQTLSLRGLLKFALGAFSGFAVNVAVTMLCLKTLQFQPSIAKATAIGIAFFFNFAVNYILVFSQRQSGAQPRNDGPKMF